MFYVFRLYLQTDVLSLYTRPLVDLWPLTSVAVCVRAVTGVLSMDDVTQLEQKRSLLGTSAVIFVLDNREHEVGYRTKY